MDCQQATQYFDDELDGALSEPLQYGLHQHLKHCTACQQGFESSTRLQAVLQDWQVPPPSAGFKDRVLQVAAERNRTWPASATLVGLAMAASLVIGIGLGLVLALAGGAPQNAVQTVAMTVDQPQNVNLAFDSAQALTGVTLTVNLPANVELVGYPGQRSLSWRTDLKAGKNQLTLPLIAHKGVSGALAASLTHGQRHKEFSLYLAVQQRRDAASHGYPLAT